MSEATGGRRLSRRNNFDALRLLLAIDVVLVHMCVLSHGRQRIPGFFPWLHAELLVPCFIAVSGFLIVMSFERSDGIRDYFERRFRRILPAYYAGIALAVVLGAVLTDLSLQGYFSSPGLWRYIGWNSIFMNFAAPTLPGLFLHQAEPGVNGALWTVKVELTFYLAVPLLLWASRRVGWYRVFGCGYALSVAYVVAWHHYAAHAHLTAADTDIVTRIARQFPGQFAYFATGAMLYHFWQQGGRPPWWGALGGVLVLIFLHQDLYTVWGDLYCLLVPASVGMICVYLALEAPYLGPVARHGDFSYGIYACHFPLVQSAVALGVFELSPYLAVPLTLGTVIVVAILSWKFIERPSLPGARVQRTESAPKIDEAVPRETVAAAGDARGPT